MGTDRSFVVTPKDPDDPGNVQAARAAQRLLDALEESRSILPGLPGSANWSGGLVARSFPARGV